jgi:hypothetical protein
VDLHNIFDLPLSITIGQFQIADLMFLRETWKRYRTLGRYFL